VIEAEEGEERVPMRGVRKRVAEAMVVSARTIPHVTHVDEVDVSRLIGLRARLRSRWRDDWPNLSYLPFIIKAVTHSLPHHPALNASVDEEAGEIVYKRHVHIGMATATPDGLIVPVIRHADRRTILDLSREIERLAEATRTRRVRLEDLRGGTFSITNYGSVGGLFGTPIIHHPESAILGVGRFFERVVRSGDGFEERTFCYLSLSFDHRVADGAHAAEFVNRVKRYLEEPETFFMELI
jgi:pyruvate dehydrogenase E2 component (dihydrolipoamide acetyltransferase)